jgi:hypothetical protein
MNTHRVTGILAWSTLAVVIGWPTYEVLTRQAADDANVAMLSRAVTTFPETIPLAVRIVGDQTLNAEASDSEPDEEAATILASLQPPVPRPAMERPLPVIPALDETPALAYSASSSSQDWYAGPFEDVTVQPDGRPFSANPFYVAPSQGGVSSGDYLLDDRYAGNGSPQFAGDYSGGGASIDGQPSGFFLDEYLRNGGRPEASRSRASVQIGN